MLLFAWKGFRPTCDKRFPSEHIGTECGGWNVIPEFTPSDAIVYSFGLGHDISFDLGLIQRFGCQVHGFDPTPRSLTWLHQKELPEDFLVHEIGISRIDGELELFEPVNANYVSCTKLSSDSHQNSISVPVKRLSTVLTELGHDRLDILKMDVEGCEYEVIDDLKASNLRPKQLLVEFHHQVLNMGVDKTKRAFQQLTQMGYVAFHISDTGNEFCFVHTS